MFFLRFYFPNKIYLNQIMGMNAEYHEQRLVFVHSKIELFPNKNRIIISFYFMLVFVSSHYFFSRMCDKCDDYLFFLLLSRSRSLDYVRVYLHTQANKKKVQQKNTVESTFVLCKLTMNQFTSIKRWIGVYEKESIQKWKEKLFTYHCMVANPFLIQIFYNAHTHTQDCQKNKREKIYSKTSS